MLDLVFFDVFEICNWVVYVFLWFRGLMLEVGYLLYIIFLWDF